MNKLLMALALCAGMLAVSGCAEEMAYAQPPAVVATGTVEFCDDWGCRMITAPYYYDGDVVVYWDAHFGCWVGPHGYWLGGGWHTGWVPGYHEWYGAHFYHRWNSHPGGWRAGTGWHGYRGGGGHGGHHR